MKDVNSSCLRDVHPMQGACQLVYNFEGLKFSIENTHRKLFYCKTITIILVFFHIGVVAQFLCLCTEELTADQDMLR